MNNDSLGIPYNTIKSNYSTPILDCQLLQENTNFTENIQNEAPNV